MWSTVYPSFGSPVFTLRGPRSRTSTVHFGKSGLHQGQDEREACVDKGEVNILVEDIDKSANIKNEWQVQVYRNQPGYKAGFTGWGGWGDTQDPQLCMDFAKMHRDDFQSVALCFLTRTFRYTTRVGRLFKVSKLLCPNESIPNIASTIPDLKL